MDLSLSDDEMWGRRAARACQGIFRSIDIEPLAIQ
jgi:hypothetical protein